jgi:hypothetical protein
LVASCKVQGRFARALSNNLRIDLNVMQGFVLAMIGVVMMSSFLIDQGVLPNAFGLPPELLSAIAVVAVSQMARSSASDLSAWHTGSYSPSSLFPLPVEYWLTESKGAR